MLQGSGDVVVVGAIVPELDAAAARLATPGCADRAFPLSAGSSLAAQTTLDAVVGYVRREAQVGGYQAADEVADVLQQGRTDLAVLVGSEPSEIAFVPSDSAGWDSTPARGSAATVKGIFCT